jgi:hypothetical protein
MSRVKVLILFKQTIGSHSITTWNTSPLEGVCGIHPMKMTKLGTLKVSGSDLFSSTKDKMPTPADLKT